MQVQIAPQVVLLLTVVAVTAAESMDTYLRFPVFPHHQSPKAIGVVTGIGASDIYIPPPRQEPWGGCYAILSCDTGT